MLGINKDLIQRDAEGRPIRIGLIGAGQMGTDIVSAVKMMKGITIPIVSDINIDRAKQAYEIAGYKDEIVFATTADEVDSAILGGKFVVVKDYKLLTKQKNIDVVVEATGFPEIGAHAALETIRNHLDLAMMNVETDITVGPIINWYAKQHGQLYALAAGDEPAACKDLYDFANALGFTIVAAGKGKNNPLDRYSSPDDQIIQKEAAKRGLNPNMLVEFIDGSKTMIEMAVVSNATGLIPDIRGMHGPHTDRDHLHKTFATKEDGGILNQMGVVDFGVGRVAPGVFLIIHTNHPRLQEAMVLRDMGEGPYYTLFRPYHLCSIEVPLTCAMLVIRNQSNMYPLEHLVSDVFAVAKKDLQPGDVLDGIGGTTFYSLIDTYENTRADNLVPIGLAKGSTVTRAIKKDDPISFEEVDIIPSIIYSLWQLQSKWMQNKISEKELLVEVNKLGR